MFDIGFWELVVVAVVALLVVGPERLPKLARTVGLWVGKAQGFIRTVKADIDRELATEELRQTLAKQAELPELQELIDETRSDLDTKVRSTQAEPKPDYLVQAARDDRPSPPPSTPPAAPGDKPSHDGKT